MLWDVRITAGYCSSPPSSYDTAPIRADIARPPSFGVSRKGYWVTAETRDDTHDDVKRRDRETCWNIGVLLGELSGRTIGRAKLP